MLDFIDNVQVQVVRGEGYLTLKTGNVYVNIHQQVHHLPFISLLIKKKKKKKEIQISCLPDVQ